ncbi:hypothetical protein SCHPADRAFT_914510 [Schizopora paradoxa]|uniref:Amidohydrolase-related domain-containing protein n=1 Tax=Schizopora paradoxa TaxID=27342 RepID=A0A0H2RUI3_9AGAM|nr:hypothetical protein SCHPADRAFT_914510 [Schizopora paradoxa]
MNSKLARTIFTYPAVDNHAHPLLKASHKDHFPFEGVLSEATGEALKEDSINSLACYRATKQLAKLFDCENDWEAVKTKRDGMDYEELCNLCMKSTGIQCLLLDDGLDSDGITEPFDWHDKFTPAKSKRIVRIEWLAQNLLKDRMKESTDVTLATASALLSSFSSDFDKAITGEAQSEDVAGFKSVACYRTGLDVSPVSASLEEIEEALMVAMKRYIATGKLRLADKAFNDYLVRVTMEVAGKYGKPVQFHTGLGDNDIVLARSSPAHLQPLIAAYPQTPVVLLHASYPFTREAGYLAAVYRNVFLDFGEVFPCVSAEGQRAVVRQVLELAPTTKIMWSTDGHWWPETYYLGTLQAREALFEVLEESVRREELSEEQAIGVAQRALFYNANKLYRLGLEPDLKFGLKTSGGKTW